MNGYQELNTTQDSALTVARSTGKCRRAQIKNDLTQEEVRSLLDYCPETGELRWVKRNNKQAGYKAITGYTKICINRKSYFAHRIIWLWWYGYLPENPVDHIDRNPSNNSLNNLREITPQCNVRNRKVFKQNFSGITGVSWHASRSKWLAKIKVNSKDTHLGVYKDLTEAVAHRLAAEQYLDWSGCDSNSSAYQYMQKYVKG